MSETASGMDDIVQRCNLRIGDTVDNKYAVDRILGEGSFGRVYAIHDRYGNDCALKILKLWEVPSEIRASLVARFDMEFATGQIDSPYLVHSLAHGTIGGNPYIVMEYCPGGDLSAVPDGQKADLNVVASHVLLGLKALHACGKVHRDLKPENVMVKGNGNYALTDFGISGDRNKRMTERNILGKPKQIFGTYAYMPPEQLNPRKDVTVLPTTDIFSFGVMMYQFITGRLPFGPLMNESDLVKYLKKGKSGAWDRHLLAMADERREWESLIDGCLQPDFKQRLQTVDEVLQHVPHAECLKECRERQCRVDYQTRVVKGVLLRIMQGEEYGRVYKLDDMLSGTRQFLRMGRMDDGAGNDIPIVENQSCYISRRHCTLELDYDTGKWVIRDGQWDPCSEGGWKRSTNGTYVGSQEVPVCGIPFDVGDIISIGDTKLRAEAY